MFALRRLDGKFYCRYNPATGKGGFRTIDECFNISIEHFPSLQNKRRERILYMRPKIKVKVVKLTNAQVHYITFIKLQNKFLQV